MRTLKLTAIFVLVAMAIFIVVGMSGLRSQRQYAVKMNAPAYISTTSSDTEITKSASPTAKKNSIAGQKTKNQSL